MNVKLTIDETTLKNMIYDYVLNVLHNTSLAPEDIRIEVKSKQNYKAEWEVANFRAVVDKEINLNPD